MSPEERAQLRERLRQERAQLEKLSPEQRAALRERWRNASPKERQQMREDLRRDRDGGGSAPARPER
jgi:hypothetical protein